MTVIIYFCIYLLLSDGPEGQNVTFNKSHTQHKARVPVNLTLVFDVFYVMLNTLKISKNKETMSTYIVAHFGMLLLFFTY